MSRKLYPLAHLRQSQKVGYDHNRALKLVFAAAGTIHSPSSLNLCAGAENEYRLHSAYLLDFFNSASIHAFNERKFKALGKIGVHLDKRQSNSFIIDDFFVKVNIVALIDLVRAKAYRISKV